MTDLEFSQVSAGYLQDFGRLGRREKLRLFILFRPGTELVEFVESQHWPCFRPLRIYLALHDGQNV